MYLLLLTLNVQNIPLVEYLKKCCGKSVYLYLHNVLYIAFLLFTAGLKAPPHPPTLQEEEKDAMPASHPESQLLTLTENTAGKQQHEAIR